MSKIDLRIELDRPGRTYEPGDEVAGTVEVVVHGDVGRADLLIEPFWWAHGKGSSYKVPGRPLRLRQGPWRAGEPVSVPFRVQAPPGPPTYHGQLFEISHFLRARMDVPWTLDAKVSADFFLLPGAEPYPNQPQESLDSGAMKQGVQQVLAFVGAVAALVGLAMGPPAVLLLLPGGIALAFFAMRAQLTKQRLGGVDLSWGRLTAAPGDELSLRLVLTPSNALQVNSVHMKLSCTEICIKGSGQHRKVRKHVLSKARYDLQAPKTLKAGVSHEFRGSAQVPDIPAYSFKTSHNKIVWRLEVCVDLPVWPDWIAAREVVIVPPEQLGAARAVAQPAPPAEQPADSTTEAPMPLDSPIVDAPAAPPGKPEDPDPVAPEAAPAASEPPAPADSSPELVALLDRLAALTGYGRERDDLIAEQSSSRFDCTVEVQGSERTYTPREQRLRNGRTLIGVVLGTEHKVALQLPESENEAVEALERGARWRGRCGVSGWNLIHRRTDMTRAE